MFIRITVELTPPLCSCWPRLSLVMKLWFPPGLASNEICGAAVPITTNSSNNGTVAAKVFTCSVF